MQSPSDSDFIIIYLQKKNSCRYNQVNQLRSSVYIHQH